VVIRRRLRARPLRSPTLFADVDNRMRIAQEEIFGPVLCLIPYADEAQAIQIANDSPFGLSSGVWAGSTERACNWAGNWAGQCFLNGAAFNYQRRSAATNNRAMDGSGGKRAE
jgi:aldehyde dehydrogenase (NAD+)